MPLASTRTRSSASMTGLLGADAAELAKPFVGCISKVAMAGVNNRWGCDQRISAFRIEESTCDKV
jgi:hypothetical protein